MTQEILDFLDKHPTFLATKGTCGNPRVRPMQFALFKNGRLYFCTAKFKGIYKHIQNFNNVEFSAFDNQATWIRIRGVAKFDEDLSVKEAMFEKYPVVKEIYKTPSNPDFAVFYLEEVSIKIQDFNGRDEVIKG
ncbi:pyridoxamine 5'-phosphate oxidase family protein [Helicobacter mesocricetorum]|uniref:pyridoxamine 5'-phosphate oxidase family protein n=1 Tax=Helicobacter mesocricetorum TaxID=87012 RepID=UPI000CF1013D|nr:pyridoxamine 5'-phosphate oxidase family protein [Helicobacter mesocricetorum]